MVRAAVGPAWGRAALLACAWWGGCCSDGALPLDIEATVVPLRKDSNEGRLPHADDGAAGSAASAELSFLGCLRLRAAGANARAFGGISGAALNGSRLVLVSDTKPMDPAPGESPKDEDSHWGAGRLFVADLLFAQEGLGRGVRPVGVRNASVRQLRDRYGDVVSRNYFRGDTESIAVDWPGPLFVGVEHTHVVRRYAVMSDAFGPADAVTVGTPKLLGARGFDKSLKHLHGVGAQLQGCTADGGNNGAEALARLRGDRMFVVCEHDTPGSSPASTIGWLADESTGRILATYNLMLPRVHSARGDVFYRVSGSSAVPGTDDVLVLFHYWSWKTGNLVKLGRATLATKPPPDGAGREVGAEAARVDLTTEELLDLRERDGYPVGNFEAVVVVPTEEPDTYGVHLLSDNNFDERHQRTLLFSMLMRDRAGTALLGASGGAPISAGALAAATQSHPGGGSLAAGVALVVSTTAALSLVALRAHCYQRKRGGMIAEATDSSWLSIDIE